MGSRGSIADDGFFVLRFRVDPPLFAMYACMFSLPFTFPGL